jgi:hypothetical protein
MASEILPAATMDALDDKQTANERPWKTFQSLQM